MPRNVEKEEESSNVVSGKNNVKIKEIFLKIYFLSGETKCFAMSADFAVLCQCVPHSMGHISMLFQRKI